MISDVGKFIIYKDTLCSPEQITRMFKAILPQLQIFGRSRNLSIMGGYNSMISGEIAPETLQGSSLRAISRQLRSRT